MSHRGTQILLGAFLVAASVWGVTALKGAPRATSAAPTAGAAVPVTPPPLPDKIDFNRDVRPILSDNCFACHGFDKNKRKADLRLDTKEGFFGKSENGTIVTPGKPLESELYKRVIADDPDERMPDPKSNKRLSPRDVAVIKKWIEQGAEHQGHWAYIKPARAAAPSVELPGFVRNPIDRFILARLQSAGLKPSPEADKVMLIRRVTFDLTGLPPTNAEVDAFVSDRSEGAYERVVDRLLASPAFGERMAMYWLDLVRFADTIGYHSDNPMNVSPYRDYVIHSFNTNKPFDRFTIEQLAGDLLPDATTEQKVATAYNRLLQTTEEGGAQGKEYEQKYVADRVRNVSTVWLGQTLGCAQCHDHKFDPFTQKDFYTLGAFFADVQEAATGRREPGMPIADEAQAAELKKVDEAVAATKKKLETSTPELAAAQAEWERRSREGGEAAQSAVAWKPLAVETTKTAGGTVLFKEPDDTFLVENPDKAPAKETYTLSAKSDLKGITAFRLETIATGQFPERGPGLAGNGNFVLTEFKASAASAAKPLKFAKSSADHSQDSFPIANAIDGKGETGWAILPEVGKNHAAVFELAKPLDAEPEKALTFTLEFQSQYARHQIGKLRLSATTSPNPAGAASTMPAKVKEALAEDAEKRTDAQKGEIAAYYRTIAPLLQPVRDEVASLEKKKDELLKAVPKVLVTTAAMPRTVRILPRGNWLDDSGEAVSPAIPHVFGEIKPEAAKDAKEGKQAKDARLTRLDLARWIVSKDNPLTARVFVNRLWKLYFGQGLSKVLDDIGAQGEWPTHPELLDWMACEFEQSGWDVKHMTRLLVTSGEYRQSSKPTVEQKERDPYNRLYARQSRFRLDAEMVRDNALAVSGLLVERQGGPSVFPYQPPGYWFALNFPTREWKNDKEDGLYRRGLYTHWQRSFLHPSLLAFDAPSREESVCERARSNIPQQALVLLNDPTYVEAARVFAERIMKEGGDNPLDRIRWAYGRALSRRATNDEVNVLVDLFGKHLKEYGQDKELAKKLLTVGDHTAATDLDPSELAAWTNVARVVLNLSETITRY